MTRPERGSPPTVEAAVMRTAADIIGSEKLARQLGIKPRTLYSWMNGTNPVKGTAIEETLALLVEHRQKVAEAIRAIRAVRDGVLT